MTDERADFLRLRGTIDRVETTRRKPPANSWNEPSGGDLKITIVTKRPHLPKAPRLTYLPIPKGQAFSSLKDVEDATEERLRDAIANLRAVVEPVPAADDATKRARSAAIRKRESYDELQQFADRLEDWLSERAEHAIKAGGFKERMQQYIMTVALGVALEGEDVTMSLAPDTEAVRQMFPGMSALSEVIEGAAAEMALVGDGGEESEAD